MAVGSLHNSKIYSNRRLSDNTNNVSQDNNIIKREKLGNERRCTTPPSSLEINTKDYRQTAVENILSIVTKHIDDSVELDVQKSNLYSLILCLSGILHNRTCYKMFKDIDFNSLSDRIAKYISHYIPNLGHLDKSLKKVAYDLIRICDNPRVKPSFIRTLDCIHAVFMGRRSIGDMFDDPKYERLTGVKLTKYAQFIRDFINIRTTDEVHPECIKEDIIDSFTDPYYSRAATSIMFHIWDLHTLNLNKTVCTQVNLSHITLQDMNMNAVNFQETDFRYAMLVDVTFTNCDFRLACFDESILKNVEMINCRLEGATFTKAIINDSTINIQIPRDLINDEIGGSMITERFLQHKHYKGFELVNRYSILTTIDSIQGIYPELKVELVNQVIKGIWRGSKWQHIDFFGRYHYNVKSFIDVIMQENSIYMKDRNIRYFMLEAVLDAKLRLANKQKEKFNKQEVVLLIKNVANNINNKKYPILANVNGISQLLYWTHKHMSENTVMLPHYDIVHKATFAAAGFANKYKEYNSDENKCYIITNEDKHNKIFAFLGEINFGKLFKEGYNSVTWDEVMYSADGSNGEDGSEAQILGDKAETVLANFALFKNDYERWLNVQKTHMTKSKLTRHTII